MNVDFVPEFLPTINVTEGFFGLTWVKMNGEG
jgi:hypothetical protein